MGEGQPVSVAISAQVRCRNRTRLQTPSNSTWRNSTPIRYRINPAIFRIYYRRDSTTTGRRSGRYHAALSQKFDRGHKGVAKTYRSLWSLLDWPHMQRDVDLMRSYRTYQEQKRVRRTHEGMLITNTPARSFGKVALDTVGPPPLTPSGNRHVLTLQCQLSKFCMAIPLPDTRVISVADALSCYFIAIFRGASSINNNAENSLSV